MLHVDNHVIVVRKEAGIPVVPDDSGDVSLLEVAKSWIAREFEKPGAAFLGVVHRLDRPVSGVVVFARTSKGARRLTDAFRSRAVSKTYRAVTTCSIGDVGDVGTIEHHLVKDRARNTVRVCTEGTSGAKLATTTWRVLAAASSGRCLVELVPVTGRPHQLRVAMASLGAPLVGDLRYGASEPLLDRSIALHARSIRFPHPTRDETLELSTPEPDLDVWRFGETRGPAGANG